MDGPEEAQGGRDRRQAPAGRCVGLARRVGGGGGTLDRRDAVHLLPLAEGPSFVAPLVRATMAKGGMITA